MEQPLSPCTSSEQGRLLTCKEPSSFSSRFLCLIFQLTSVQYLLKFLQKASVWIGSVVPVEAVISKVHPPLSPTRPGQLIEKLRGRLTRLLLSIVPNRVQNILGYLLAEWGQINMPKGTPAEIREDPINPFNNTNKRKWDDIAREEQESWLAVLERDLPEDDSEDLPYEPSDVETDSEEYKSQNDTEADLELEEQDGIIMLKESLDLQGKQEP